jgi:hypothetical protein
MADAGKDRFDPQAQPAPDYEFDQRVAWYVPRQGDAPVARNAAARAWGYQADCLCLLA